MYKKPRILVVGSFVMDIIVSTNRVPKAGETVIDGLSFNTAPGGKGANQAVQAAKLGASVDMVGKVGRDAFGDQLLVSARRAGVNVEHVLHDDQVSSGIGNIILELKPGEKVENRIIVVPGANMRLELKDVEFLSEGISKYDLLMLQLEIPMEINEVVAEYANKKGIPVMLNPAPAACISEAMLSKLTYISPNEHEAAALTGVEIGRHDNEVDLAAARVAAEALLRKGVKNVIITLGSSGAILLNKDKFIYRPCAAGVTAVDPTAAGDSFTGAFCTAVCMGMQEEKAVEFANNTAAITVSRLGAQPSLPDFQEVTRLMECNGHV